MKRFILLSLCLFVAVGVLLLNEERAGSVVTGPCSNCHTMHDSQNGQQVTTGGPYMYLLKGDCIWCHSGASGQLSTAGAPIVYHTSDPTSTGPGATLAGGDFYWVASAGGADDAKGHNVAGLAGPDGNIVTNPPPGYNIANSPYNRGNWLSSQTQVTCAGSTGNIITGCHGDPNTGAFGGHHLNVTGGSDVITGTTVYNSYRFLYGIYGYEDADWQWTASPTDHNEYFGVNGNQNNNNPHTISSFCSQCHGNFHQGTGQGGAYGTGSPWYRHPTDYVLPGTGEYANYNPDNGNVYNIVVPVARPAIPTTAQGPSDVVNPGDDTTRQGAIVMCLSCHRVHGSEYDDILRFNYAAISAGTGNADVGCFVCHTSKNADNP